MVEKYEQMLAQDPTSSMFVELSRAYIERGENDRAIETCQRGLTHHPNSVVGRVLWGKALINVGKAAEAMKQFDLAVNIDRDNPHAYNLISEALLRKGLYRSALPILRRAAALQPNDARIVQWLEQTKQALAGGPAPSMSEATTTDTTEIPLSAVVARTEQVPAVQSPPVVEPETDPFAALLARQTRDEPDNHPTVVMRAMSPPVPTDELPLITGTIDAPVVTKDEPDPFAALQAQSPSTEVDTVHGLTSTFNALSEGALAEVPRPVMATEAEPSVVLGADLTMPVLREVVSAQTEMPTTEFQTPGVNVPAPRVSRGGLLDDIPDEPQALPTAKSSRPEALGQSTEAAAKEYERELRAKLEVTKQKKTFFHTHRFNIAAVSALFVVGLGLGGSFIYTRLQNKGETLDTALAKGLSAVNADTKEQYLAAIRSLEQALKMDKGNAEASALAGYAHAMLFAEHGGTSADREAAMAAFGSSAVREARPDLALVVDFCVADPELLGAARQQLLGSSLEKSVVQAQVGRLLLGDKKYDEALTRLKQATELDPRNTRAMVALGEYYLAFEDWDSAIEMLGRAEALSRFHPRRVIGHAQARLELGRELPEALADLEGLPGTSAVPPAIEGRYRLMLGRALAANGRFADATKTFTDAQAADPALGFELAVALGHAHRLSGDMVRAQKSFEEALKLSPKSEVAKEGLGRVLLARSREKELLERFRPEKDAKRISLLRGIAWFRLGDAKKARAELQATRESNGKYTAEAAVYLALADASEEGQSDAVIQTLEKFASTLRKNKSTVQVALARMYLQKGALDKARAVLEEAAKDPQDSEANALLGELLLKAGVPVEVSIEPLTRAVERNGSHTVARHLLVRSLLAMGKPNDAVTHVEKWTTDDPSPESFRDAALVYLQAGKLKEAESAAAKIPTSSDEVEVWRTRALISFGRANGAEAMKALERANQLNPKDGETFCEIGNAFVRQGNYDAAKAAYDAAIREDKKLACGLAGPFHAKPVAKGNPSPGQVLEKLISQSRHAWERAFLLATLARVHLVGNDVAAARTTVDEALQAGPFHPAAWFAAGEVARGEKDEVQALEAWGKAAELDGSSSQARLAFAESLAKGGREKLPLALVQYEAVLLIDQNEIDLARAKKAVAMIKKQLSP